MIAKAASLKDIIESEPHRLEIPFFQRRYVWKEENWQELLEALEHFKEEKVFWGSVIIKLSSEKETDDAEHYFSKGYVIDGQQRLTTIALLTKAIYDSVGENEDWCQRIAYNDLFFPPYTSAPKEKYELIIKHSRIDKEEFEHIVKAGIFNDERVEIEKDTGGQISRCYAYFKNCFKQKKKEELAELIDNLYGDEKVFVQITLDEKDVNEQAIFDSINRAGQKLYTSDIIKNNLFKKLMYLTNDSERVCKLCDKYWDNIFWTDEFWDEKRRFGNIGKSHLDFLLYSVACIKWADESLQNINENLETIFEQKTEALDESELIELISDISKYALIYKKYIYEFGESIEEASFSKEEHVNRLLLIMDKFKIQMFYPYVLKKLYENIISYDIERKQVECNLSDYNMNQEVRLLEAYIVRRRIYGASTSGYSKKCMEVLREGIMKLYSDYVMEGEDNDVIKENKEVKEALRNIGKAEVVKMILFCLELTRWDERDDMGKLAFNYQIEHIMPQKWKEYWALSSNCSEDERNQRIKEIGNMLLLNQKLNKHIQNREYKVKMEGIHEGKKIKEGYKDRTQLKMTKEIVDQYDGGDKTWDEEHIRKRTEKIAEEVIKHWDIVKLIKEVQS